jgi:hypothetical protein
MSRGFWFIGSIALLISFTSGCASRHRLASIDFQLPPLGPFLPSFPPLPEARLPTPLFPARDLFPWLNVSEFFPARAEQILPPGGYREPHYVETSRAWFPSIASSTSPNGEWTLTHEGDQHADGMDYVIFAQRRGADGRRAIFKVRRALEIVWSPDSTRAAITVLTGSNRSAVRILRVPELTISRQIVPDEALGMYLRPVQIEAPHFLLVLRWTDTGDLVLRARGNEPLEASAVFGYEVAVDTEHFEYSASAIRFLRGYVKRASGEQK